MQQLSHQTLNSATVLTIFAVFTVPPDFVCLAWLFLKTHDCGPCVVRSVPAPVECASQNELFGRLRPSFLRSFTMIESEKDWHFTLLAAYSEIPSVIGSRPSRNIHRFYSYQRLRACFVATRERASVATQTNPIALSQPTSFSASHPAETVHAPAPSRRLGPYSRNSSKYRVSSVMVRSSA